MDSILDISLINTGIKTVAMLALVLGCLVFVLFFMRKFLRPGLRKKGDLDMKRLGAFYFSPKERIEVVEISGERIVLGVSPGCVNYITTLKDINEDSL